MFSVGTKVRNIFQTQQHEGTQIFCCRGWACPCPIPGRPRGSPLRGGVHSPIWQGNQHFIREIRVKQFFQIIRKEEPMNHRRWHCKLGISDLPNFLYAIHQYAENVSNYLSQELSYGHKQKQLLINQNHQLESLMPEACSSLAQRNQ